MIFGFILIAIVIGILMPVQAGLNAELGRHLGHPYLSALTSLTIGAIAVSGLVFFNEGFAGLKNLTQAQPHLFLGGVLGALFVGSSLILIPRMGATAMVGAFITGQLLGSVIIDHLGLFGLRPYALNYSRLFGIFLLFAGLFLVVRKSA
jgi:transporter family-2 protein